MNTTTNEIFLNKVAKQIIDTRFNKPVIGSINVDFIEFKFKETGFVYVFTTKPLEYRTIANLINHNERLIQVITAMLFKINHPEKLHFFKHSKELVKLIECKKSMILSIFPFDIKDIYGIIVSNEPIIK